MSRPLCVALSLCLALAGAAPPDGSKQASRLVTATMRASAVANAKTDPWAKAIQSSAVAAAAGWLVKSDRELCELVTSQELPRASYTKAGILYRKKTPGCPNCGERALRFGDSWKRDPQRRPWKLQCASCGEVFPKNDFAAFYATALDEHGFFRRDRGDRSLLVNSEHPNPNDPLHKLYVDDGYGMLDFRGEAHHMVAYYNNAQWGLVRGAVATLARAYTLTDDVRYAHKAAVLLDRIADVYPEMDFAPLHKLGFQHSQGGTGRGRIEGCIAECFVGQQLAADYDRIFDGMLRDPDLAVYQREKAARYRMPERKTPADVCRHIEDHLILEILRSCKDERIAGNIGMTHTCAATAAIALDRAGETDRWLDWLFAPEFPGWRGPGGIPWVLADGIDSDGMGGECGGYGLIWSRHFIDLAVLLGCYPRHRGAAMAQEFPKLRQCFFVESRLMCLDAVMPPIGDSGNTGGWSRIGDPTHFALGFKLYGDPRLARLAWDSADGKVERLRRPGDVFLPVAERPSTRIAALAAGSAPPPLKSDHLGRYGQAVLQTPDRQDGRAAWIHYGYGKGHSHGDALAIGLYAKNVDMLPDLGYPAYTGSFPERICWTSNTISHNTLLVGDARSAESCGGKLTLFALASPLRAVSAESPKAYRASRYERQVALIDVGDRDSYLLDVFRAQGGTNHRLSWHGPAQAATIDGVRLNRQAGGSFAGPQAKPCQLQDANGYTYLYDVERSNGPAVTPYTVDWKAEDLRGRIAKGSEPHLRLHALTGCDEVALASGTPPQNKPGNPRSLRYLVQSRLGKGANSQFVNVLEPYDGRPFIRQVLALHAEHAGAPEDVAAVAVEMAGGDTDIVIACRKPLLVKVDGKIELDGQLGLVRMSAGQVKSLRMANARRLKAAGVELTSPAAAWQGKVVRVDTTNAEDQRVYLEPGLPQPAEAAGRTIHFATQLPWDTSFEIRGAGKDWISTGGISLVCGLKSRTDARAGYTYLVNAGDEYTLPLTAAVDR